MIDALGAPPDDPVTLVGSEEDFHPDSSPVRRAVGSGLVSIAAALVAGGLFTPAFSPRAIAVVAAIAGTALALGLGRLRSATTVGVATVGGVFAIGCLALVLNGGFGSLTQITTLVSKALTQSNLLRPPIGMTTGFAALVGWLCAGTAFATAWVAVVVRRPVIALLVPLPVAAICAISTPTDAQLATGLAIVVAFAAGLFLTSTDPAVSGMHGTSMAYEIRRAVRAVPVVGGIAVALVLLARAGVLFPPPVIDPALEAEKPKAIPLSKAPDRPLFDVAATVTGPWVMGTLDVFDGTDWRLPPFDAARLRRIDRSGVVDRSFRPGLKATITVRGLTGAVLPTLPNTVGVVARGPRLAFDARSGNIRLVEGEIGKGYTYSLASATVPQVADLRRAPEPPTALVREFTQAPRPPDVARALIDSAPKKSPWDTWDHLRRWVLDNVTSSGAGSPSPIPPSRVTEIIERQEGSPFEIVALQTLFARWVGIPARIGYGFDGGQRVDDHLEVRPRDGAVFPQVYFEGNGWLPVIGTPAKTKVTDTSNPELQQYKPGVLPSDDISVTIYRPVSKSVGARLFERLRPFVGIAVGVLVLAALIYLALTPIRKTLRRARRRAEAIENGPHARIAQTYAEWRDLLTDFGYSHGSDTPLMLLRRFPPDAEHNQLAWVVTRTLWGDLSEDTTEQMAGDAEELSKSMQRRLRDAHPITVRAVAALSRLSLRDPYDAGPVAVAVPAFPRETADVA